MSNQGEAERRIAEAQAVVAVRIMGVIYRRVAHGAERAGWDSEQPCHDCGVGKAQLHVLGCDAEACPRCARQLISCECTNDERVAADARADTAAAAAADSHDEDAHDEDEEDEDDEDARDDDDDDDDALKDDDALNDDGGSRVDYSDLPMIQRLEGCR